MVDEFADTINDCRTERYQRLRQALCTPAEQRTPEDVIAIAEYGGTGISRHEAEVLLQMAAAFRALEKLERLLYG